MGVGQPKMNAQPDTDQRKASKSKPDAKDDLKSLPMPELQAKLGSSPDGLSQVEAQKRLAQYGPNELRILIARWVALPAFEARRLYLETSSVSILSYDHDLEEPVIRVLNDARHAWRGSSNYRIANN